MTTEGRRPWQDRPVDGNVSEDPVRLDQALDVILAGMGAPPASAVRGLEDRWAELVGAEAAAHCRPVRVAHGRLVVEVDAPAWASQLRWRAAELIARAGDLVGPGVVEEIDVTVVRT